MAKLPNAESAVIESNKLYGYILSPTHPLGRFKAAFFLKLGYSADNWRAFEQSLRAFIISNDATEVEESQYGKKYVVEGPLNNSSGRAVQIITVWVILKNETAPRFVTAYPRELQ